MKKLPRAFLRLAQPLDARPKVGVYVLLLSERVVYIGQSTDVDARLAQHRRAAMFQFDSAQWFRVADDDLDAHEGALIRFFDPPFTQGSPAFREIGRDEEILVALGVITAAQARSKYLDRELAARRPPKDEAEALRRELLKFGDAGRAAVDRIKKRGARR